VLDFNAKVTGMRLARLPLTKQKVCIFKLHILHATVFYLQKFNTNMLHYTFLFFLFDYLCWPGLLAIFRESFMTYVVHVPN
jgi:hypothetical protein